MDKKEEGKTIVVRELPKFEARTLIDEENLERRLKC